MSDSGSEKSADKQRKRIEMEGCNGCIPPHDKELNTQYAEEGYTKNVLT